jgi:hypothetical protein
MTTPTLPTDLTDRLVTLCDGRTGLRGGIQVDVRDAAPDSSHSPTDPLTHSPSPAPSPALDFIASDETLDRYNEVIMARGWQLENYRRNPVFQNAHQYGDVIFTLGKALITEVRDGRLYQRIEFATDVNPMAKIAYGLYKGKFLNAVSVGFIPIKWEDAQSSSSSLAAPKSDAGGSSQPRRRYLEQELLEVSAVGIPANPNALALGLKSGVIEKSDLTALAELIRLTISENAQPGGETPTCSHPARARLLRLARELRTILKRA